MRKYYGEIKHVDFSINDHGFLVLGAQIKTDGGAYVTSDDARVTLSEIKGFTNKLKILMVDKIISLLEKAKVDYLSELKGKRVCCWFRRANGKLHHWKFVDPKKYPDESTQDIGR